MSADIVTGNSLRAIAPPLDDSVRIIWDGLASDN